MSEFNRMQEFKDIELDRYDSYYSPPRKMSFGPKKGSFCKSEDVGDLESKYVQLKEKSFDKDNAALVKKLEKENAELKKEVIEFRKSHSKAVLIFCVNDDLSERETLICNLLNKNFECDEYKGGKG